MMKSQASHWQKTRRSQNQNQSQSQNHPILITGLSGQKKKTPHPCQWGGGERTTDSVWSLKVWNIEGLITTPKEPVLYYLHNGPK